MVLIADKKRATKKAVIARDNAVCVYCEVKLAQVDITMDHIIPVSRNGLYSITNLTVSCSPCNMKRGDTEFFEWIEQFHFPQAKVEKYHELNKRYWKIKVLNVAKEKFIKNEFEVAQELINQTCDYLRNGYGKKLDKKAHVSQEYQGLLPKEIDIDFTAYTKRGEIIYAFEQLILLLEQV